MSNQYGFDCPECKNLIPTTTALLLQGTIHCIACGLKLEVDNKASKASLEAIRKLSESSEAITASTKQALPKGTVDTKISGAN